MWRISHEVRVYSLCILIALALKCLKLYFFPSFSPSLKHLITQIFLKGLFLKILSTHTSLFILFKYSVCAVGGPLSERSKIHRISK